ncbi:MAG: class I poly(R)-hydroxyalkanoic acid synthase [Rickettsiaceae bacterium]|nr:class I poly(R)-hydroxyalkanoic acid synthase [Rickettsiaceae bacterium]
MSEFKDADKLIANIKEIGTKYQEAILRLMNSRIPQNMMNNFGSGNINSLAKEVADKIIDDPQKFIDTNIEYGHKFAALVNNTMKRFIGEETEPIYNSSPRDRRFKDPLWHQNLYFDFIKQFYIMSSHWISESTKKLELEPKTQQILEFYTRQFTDAFCPSNFPFYNPEVIKESLSTKWENISQGLDNFIEDLKNCDGILNIKTTDKMAFKLGENIASTEGKVVMQNDLMQLICYKPKAKARQIPILITPPWINKYYILDLSPENSFVKWLVDNDFQVFLISWVNPKENLSHKNFEDYASEGIIAACEYIRSSLNVKDISTIGYCIGGTLLACALSIMKTKKMDYINSATFLTTLLDFSNSGEVGIFVNEESVSAIEKEMDEKGFFDGRYLAHSFSMLRANDLIWSFFVNNYLLGKRPLPFDLLYWNSDPTNLPAKMHSFYLRNMYLENNLTKAGKVTMLGEKIELKNVEVPSFSLAAKEDHIAPWRGAFESAKLLGGKKEFCLSASGHVAGVVNPPNQNKYSYWTSQENEDSDTWLASATQHEGSWWKHWLEWQSKYSGEKIQQENYNSLKAIEKAPGSYVAKES